MILIVWPKMRTFKEWRHDRLILNTPLLPDYEHVALDPTELKRVHSKYRMCRRRGHLWELEALVPSPTDFPYTYYVKCAACFPHMQSRRTYQSYNLFALSEKEQD